MKHNPIKPVVVKVQHLRPKPGDLVVLSVPHTLSIEDFNDITDLAAETFSRKKSLRGVHFCFFKTELEMRVIRKAPSTKHQAPENTQKPKHQR